MTKRILQINEILQKIRIEKKKSIMKLKLKIFGVPRIKHTIRARNVFRRMVNPTI